MMKKFIMATAVIALALTGCKKSQNGFDINGEESDTDSVEVVLAEEDANNSIIPLPTIHETRKPEVLTAEGDKDSQDIKDMISKKVMKTESVREADASIREATGGKKGISIIVEENENTKGVYDIRYGYNTDEKFETYGSFRYTKTTNRLEEYDVISGSYTKVSE